MLKSILISCAFLAAVVAPAAAQSERVQEMQRVVDALNSANPLVRMATLEEVFDSKDNNLKRIALQTALESSDQALQSAAVEAAIATKKSMVLRITSYTDQHEHRLIKATGGNVKLGIHNFDKLSGDFMITSDLTDRYAVEKRGKPGATAGSYYGDRLSFTFFITTIGADATCMGTATLKQGTSLLEGAMSCGNGAFGGYGFEIDVLR